MADTDLDAGLDEAKKKPRFFAIICKGQTIVKMIVQKKRIKEGDIAYAKREHKGNASIVGVCTRTGAQLVLQVVGEEPTLKAIKVKDFINEETGAALKPEWRVVPELAEVPDSEDLQGDANPAVPAQSASEAVVTPNDQQKTSGQQQASDQLTTNQQSSAPADSHQPPPADDSKNEAIRKALKEAKGRIQQALVAGPLYKEQILGLVAAVKGHLDANDDQSSQALTRFRELAELLVTVLTPRPAQAPEVKVVDRQAIFQNMLTSITNCINQFPGDYPRKKDLTSAVASLQKQARSDLDKAIDMANGLLKWAAEELANLQAPPTSGQTPAEQGRFQELYAGLLETLPGDLSRLRTVDAAAADKIQKVVDGAAVQAGKGDYQNAYASLNQAAEALAKVTGAGSAKQAAEVIPGGIVEAMRQRLQKARIRWDAGIQQAVVEMKKVQDGLQEVHPELASALASILEGYQKDLTAFLAPAEKAEYGPDLDQSRAEVLKKATELKAQVAADILLAHLDTFPLGSVKLQKTIDLALTEIQAHLNA